MKVYFRVDASDLIGCGHVMRCLSLADELKRRGLSIVFLCRELQGNLIDLIEKMDYSVYRLPYMEESFGVTNKHTKYTGWLNVDWQTDANQVLSILENEGHDVDWLIVDHYALDNQWEEQFRFIVKKIMVIDDLANRCHYCDLLLDQNLYENIQGRYNDLVPSYCQKLLGSNYALLRCEFRELRKRIKEHKGAIRHILVFFGGSDLTNDTLKTLKAIASLKCLDFSVDIVIGINNPYKHAIEELASNMSRVTCHFDVCNMAELMLATDICIGAAGVSVWERCCLGLPSLVITVAENQVAAVEYMARKDLLYYVGESHNTSYQDIKKIVEYFLNHPERLKHYSKVSYELVDGLGTQRCADTILAYN